MTASHFDDNSWRNESSQDELYAECSSDEDGPISPLLVNESHGGKTRSYILPALDLAELNHGSHASTTKKSVDSKSNIEPPMFAKNTTSLTEAIIDDVYDSLCSLTETEIASQHKHSMDVHQFYHFFNTYIFSTLCLMDDDEMQILNQHKHFIANAVFEKLALRNSEQIHFKQFMNGIDHLNKEEFMRALNVYHSRQQAWNNSNVCSAPPIFDTAINTPLESICENSPLLDDEDEDDECTIDTEMREWCRQRDSNQNETVNLDEFKRLINTWYPSVDEAEVEQTFAEMEHNKSVQFDSQRLAEFIQELQRNSTFNSFPTPPDKEAFVKLMMQMFAIPNANGNRQVRTSPMWKTQEEINELRETLQTLRSESLRQQTGLDHLRECYAKQQLEMQSLKRTTSKMIRCYGQRMRKLFVFFLLSVFLGYIMSIRLINRRQKKLVSLMSAAIAMWVFRTYAHQQKTFFVALGLLVGFAVAFKRM